MANITLFPDDKSTVALSLLRTVADPRMLRLIILPTEQCNFRCTYCYEDFKIGRMSAGLVNALKQWFLSRVDDVDNFSLSWFGGEPTLALPIVLDVSATARDAFQKDKRTFSGSMTTNGYRLSRENFASLLVAGVRHFQISLDGPAAIHDRTRVLANGGGTFSVLWRNLTDIAASANTFDMPFHIDLRLHYDGISVRHMRALVDQIKTDLLPSGKFSVNFHEIEKLGGPHDDRMMSPTLDDHNIVREFAEELRQERGTTVAEVARDVDDYVCYAAKANAFVVRADGRIAKCTVALNDPRNEVGRLNLDGTITWHNGRLDPWLRGLLSGDARTLACPLDGMNGDIPLQARRYT
jgi:uncharacterized protein